MLKSCKISPEWFNPLRIRVYYKIGKYLISRDSTWICISSATNTEEFPLLKHNMLGKEGFSSDLLQSQRAGRQLFRHNLLLYPAKQTSMRWLLFGPSPALDGISGSSPSSRLGLHPKELNAAGHWPPPLRSGRASSTGTAPLNPLICSTLQRLWTSFFCLSSQATLGLGREKEQQWNSRARV